MSTANALCPKLSQHVIFKDLEGRCLLYHKKANTQLQISEQEREVAENMDGMQTLEMLEDHLTVGSGMAYQDLVVMIYQLWDRGMLENGDAMRDALFPHQKRRTVDQAQGRSFRWIYASNQDISGLFSCTPTLVICGILALAGAIIYIMGHAPLPTSLFMDHSYGQGKVLRPFSEWFPDLIVVYASATLMLSIRGAVRGMIMIDGPGVPRVMMRWAAGIMFLDVDDREMFHVSQESQVRFALGSLLVPAGLAGLMAVFGTATGMLWMHEAAVMGLVVVFFDLCPFFATSGARLLEIMGSLRKQRFRVQSFIRQRLVQSLFDDKSHSEDKAFRWVATAWIVWFFGLMRIYDELVVHHMLELVQVATHSPTMAGKGVATGMLAYAMVLTVTLTLTIIYVAFGMLRQVISRDKVDKPTEQLKGEQLSEEQKKKIAAQLRDIPMLSKLNDDTLGALIAHAEQMKFSENAWIYRQYEAGSGFYWIEKGEAEIHRDLPEGGVEMVTRLGTENHFGEEALLGEVRSFSVRAGRDLQTLRFDGETLRNLLKDTEHGGLDTVLEITEFLDRVPELASLGAAGRMALATRVKLRGTESDEEIIREGEEARSMYLIREGQFSVRKNTQEGEEHLADLSEGDTFGEIGLMLKRPRTASVYSSEPGELVEISSEALKEALDRSFHVGLALEQLAAKRLEA
jgi:CRP-like cAMP-binding protein